ncbi:MAG: adenylate/guanylate cyclase domain-containing protein [Burkholderiales bacterium]|nr:adenylate/guanylate cyclase domain-containing protein [Burkholderiales bacterium]
MSSTMAPAHGKPPAKIGAVVAGSLLLRHMAHVDRPPSRPLLRPKEPDVLDDKNAVTFLFTDIEGSTRLWEQQPALMQAALRRHDAMAHAAVAAHGGTMVKMTGDGLHAAFAQPLAALHAARDFALALADPGNGLELPLIARCGLHLGYDEKRAGDFFGRAVNRAARIMQCAHGGQILMSHAVAERVRASLAGEGADLLDLGLVRLRDLSEPERVHQLVQPGLREQFPALRSLASTPNNLSQQLNSFIGRERELVDLQALLAQQRLVTLIGLGGIGKTRLSMQLAAQVLDDYPDGVWFVELAPLADPQLVPQAVASVLGVKEDAGRPITEALTRFVQDRRLLITFDNCEHVVQACADLANQLLRASPSVKLLASSREALQIAGEVTYAVPPLGVPNHRHVPTVADVAAQESVRLFVDRVRVAQPAFVVDEDNALAVGQICRQLDGIPLALELAAARARQMSVTTLASRIGDRFKLLTNGDRSALPRQQTLRALIDWSHDLLSEPERALFRRLSVFAGGWTLEAAEAVCADESLPKDDILDNLGRLVEKSLISVDLQTDRYRMLETVRQYGRERLEIAAEHSLRGKLHLDYFLKLAEIAAKHLTGVSQSDWLRKLDAERENLLAAHASGLQISPGDPAGVRLVDALRVYWVVTGLYGLGMRLTLEVLERLPAKQSSHERCVVLYAAGQLCIFVGLYSRAKSMLEECLAIAREIDDLNMVGQTLDRLGAACWGANDLELAGSFLDEAVAFTRENWTSRDLAVTLTSAAQFYRSQGLFSPAQSLYMEAAEIVRDSGDNFAFAFLLVNAVMADVELGQLASAATRLAEAVRIGRGANSLAITQCVLDAAAGLAAECCDWHCAVELYGMSETLARQIGCVRDPADQSFLGSRIEAARNALGPGQYKEQLEGRGVGRFAIETIFTDLEVWLTSQQITGFVRKVIAKAVGQE